MYLILVVEKLNEQRDGHSVYEQGKDLQWTDNCDHMIGSLQFFNIYISFFAFTLKIRIYFYF